MPKYRDWMGQFIDANLDGGAKDSARIVIHTRRCARDVAALDPA